MQYVQVTLPIDSVVKDRYIVEDLLGKGGFGAVYRVRDQRVRGNKFALKEVIDPNTEERERFAFECEVLKRLDHPALPRVYRVFEDNKNIRVYMLMDYVAGPNLEILRQRQPEKRLPFPHVIKIMAPIVDAVGYLHKQQPPIIHRDIKPANIIVPDEEDHSVLVDFGIAKEYEQDGTTTAVRRCSPGYGAPEQYARGTTPRTDIYGLGATFYALITGTIPTDALYRLTQMGSRNTDPLEDVKELAPGVPQHVADAIHRAMRIDSNERFATVEEFWQALNAEPIVEPSVTIVPVAPLQKAPATFPVSMRTTATRPGVLRSVEANGTRRRRILPILFALLALLVLISGVVFGTNTFKGQYIGQNVPATATQRPIATATSTTPAATATKTQPTPSPTTAPTVTPQPTAQPTTQPTIVSATYPTLGKTYNGQVTNTFVSPNETAPIQLNSIVQNNGNITSGYLYVQPGNGLQGSGNFTGSVSTNHTIQFKVQESGILPLLFTGTIAADRSMSGRYCAANPDNSCNPAQGHGTWSVNPPSA